MALSLGRRRGQKTKGLGIRRVSYRSMAVAAFIFSLFAVAFWQGLIFAPNAVLSPSLSQEAGGLRVVANKEKTSPIRKWDSSKSVLMGLASGYGKYTFEQFVGSLRATGFSGAIILGIASDAPRDVLDYLAETNVTVKEVTLGPCTYHDDSSRSKCLVGFPDYKLSWVRFPLSKQWLLDCKECTDGIMMTDVRDAYFQADPFTHSSIKYPVPGLMTFEEIYPDLTTENWLTNAPIEKCKGYEIGNHPMLCSGSTMGTREGILNYLDVMLKEFDAWSKDKKCFSNMVGDDQSIHNHLYYSGMFGKDTAAIPHRTGPIHVVGVQANKITTEHWLTNVPIKKCKGYKIGNHPMLCSGSTMGTREGILSYIDVMMKELDVWNKDKQCHSSTMVGDDQSIHNHLYYSGMFGKDTAAIPHRTGPIHVVGVQANKIFRAAIKEAEEVGDDEKWVNGHRLYGTEDKWQEWLDPKHGLIDPKTGLITNLVGSPSPQVHQFDRFGLSFGRFYLDRKMAEW
eukprot:CAMPEP_0198303944 /NCGR_PEP_ID=MMETSP1449-20131203/57148_1 /TAXON_ID=420275 /ORGANISM="Attheya septentrionalis, Strain CCMP2084" /LENGTH=509 /DNA_ID=CAMNT_0044006451 /DNA_START=1 /DNA_END=1527 /DNA_ORIENTATION=+